jgi:hypothetical protein
MPPEGRVAPDATIVRTGRPRFGVLPELTTILSILCDVPMPPCLQDLLGGYVSKTMPARR